MENPLDCAWYDLTFQRDTSRAVTTVGLSYLPKLSLFPLQLYGPSAERLEEPDCLPIQLAAQPVLGILPQITSKKKSPIQEAHSVKHPPRRTHFSSLESLRSFSTANRPASFSWLHSNRVHTGSAAFLQKGRIPASYSAQNIFLASGIRNLVRNSRHFPKTLL